MLNFELKKDRAPNLALDSIVIVIRGWPDAKDFVIKGITLKNTYLLRNTSYCGMISNMGGS